MTRSKTLLSISEALSAQYENELDDVFASDIDSFLVLQAEPALLEDADRADVVPGHVRVEWSLGHRAEESGKCACRYTLAPMLLAEPVTDQAYIFLLPAPDVP